MNPFHTGYYQDEELSKVGFKSIGKNVKIAKNCTITDPSNITIGNNVTIDSFCSLIATGANSMLKLGSYVHIGAFCHILANGGGVEIKDYSGLSQGVKIYSKSDDYSGQSLTNATIPDKYRKLDQGKVIIDEHVIVGANSVILPNINIGAGVSIGALSLVSTNLESWNLYFGNPLRKLKRKSNGLLVLKEEFLKDLEQQEL